MTLRTSLYDNHLRLKGTMVDFAGYELPIQYPTGVLKEHLAVREGVGIFDVSHMGEAVVEGPKAAEYLDKVLSNRMENLAPGRMRYALMLNDKGGTVDDLLVYCYSATRYMLVLNAANTSKDIAHLQSHVFDGVTVTDISSELSQVAVQGPKAIELVSQFMNPADIPDKFYAFTPETTVAGQPCMLSRNGYTGEDGVEIYGGHTEIVKIYEALVEAGAHPCGLGARDTLRLEAGMPLYGHELSETLSPISAGLGMFIKFDKGDFIGKKAQEENPITQKRVGLRMTGRGIAREGSEVFIGDKSIGIVTSGTQLPFVKYAGAMAFIDNANTELGMEVEVDVRGRRVAAEVVVLPFYKKEK